MQDFLSHNRLLFFLLCVALFILVSIKTVKTVTAITFKVITTGVQEGSWPDIQDVYKPGFNIPFPSSENYFDFDILKDHVSLSDSDSFISNDLYPIEHLQSFLYNTFSTDDLCILDADQSNTIGNSNTIQVLGESSFMTPASMSFLNENYFEKDMQSGGYSLHMTPGINDNLQIKDVSSYISFLNDNKGMNDLSYFDRDFLGKDNYGDFMSELEGLESDQLISLAKERGITKQEAARIYRMVKDNPIFNNFVNQKGEKFKNQLKKLEDY